MLGADTLQGSGLSEGSYVTLGASEVDDLAAVVQYLRDEGALHRGCTAWWWLPAVQVLGHFAGFSFQCRSRPLLRARFGAVLKRCNLGPCAAPAGSTSTIGLWGRSMGAVTALLYSQRDPGIAGMVRRCAPHPDLLPALVLAGNQVEQSCICFHPPPVLLLPPMYRFAPYRRS